MFHFFLLLFLLPFVVNKDVHRHHHTTTIVIAIVIMIMIIIITNHLSFYFNSCSKAHRNTKTRSSAIAERPRDASCLSVIGFNSTIPRQLQSLLLRLQIYRCVQLNSVLFGAPVKVRCHKQDSLMRDVNMITCFDTIHERDGRTERRTDRQTPHDAIGRASTRQQRKYETNKCVSKTHIRQTRGAVTTYNYMKHLVPYSRATFPSLIICLLKIYGSVKCKWCMTKSRSMTGGRRVHRRLAPTLPPSRLT